MAIVRALFGRLWPYIAGMAGLTAGFFFVQLSGKAAARTEDAAKINKQAQHAQQEQRHVENEVAAMDDPTVNRRLGDWVRGPKGRN